MDPNLFHLDWERTFEVLMAIVVLSFFVERACALIFESRWYIRLFEDPRVAEPPAPEKSKAGKATRKKATPKDADADDAAPTAAQQAPERLPPGRLYPVKELVAFGIAFAVCLGWDFDALSVVLLQESTHLVGKAVTAAVIAGGSKASVKLFHDLMRVRSNAETERMALREGESK